MLEAQLAINVSGDIEQFPICASSRYFEIDPEADVWTPDFNATDGGEDGCFDDDGVMPGDSEGDGLDSSGGAAPPDPFGDLETLIDCSGTDCQLDAELVLNVMEYFHVFYDESVLLKFDTTFRCTPGIRLSGLDAGEESKELADEIGVSKRRRNI